MKHKFKVKTVKFIQASATYGFTSITPGKANISHIDMLDNGILVHRNNGQTLFHPFTAVENMDVEILEEAPAPAPKKASKE